MNIKNLVLVLTVCTLCFSSCALINPAGNNAIAGTEWNLVYIRKSTPLPGSTITIAFTGDEVRGSSGCNTYFGQYEIKADQIRFGSLAMTEMACKDAAWMEQEQEYLAFLSEVVSFSINGPQLILKKAGQDQLTFERISGQ